VPYQHSATQENSSYQLPLLYQPYYLTTEELDILSKSIQRERTLQIGEHLFDHQQELYCLFALQSGSMKTCCDDEVGSEQILGFFLPGEILGIEALGMGSYLGCAVALEPSRVCLMSYDELRKLCGELPNLRREIHHISAQNMMVGYQARTWLGKKNAEQRLATFILDLAQRMIKRGFEIQSLRLSMSRQDIGNYLGLSPETVSRLLSSLQKQNVIRVENRHVEIIDQASLVQKAMPETCDAAIK